MINKFNTYDYIILSMVLAVSMLIGLYHAKSNNQRNFIAKLFKKKTNEVSSREDTRSENKRTNEYLIAGGNMSSLPITFSLLASFFSTTSLLGLPAEVYQYGIEHILFTFSVMPGPIIAAFVTGPMFARLKCKSIFEYLEIRYKSYAIRLIGTSFYIIRSFVTTGIFMYGPATAIATLTNISESLAVIIIGSVATFYTTIGGIKAVIWTDVFQMIIILIGLSSVCIKGVFDVGGLQKLWEINSDGGRLNFFDFNPNPLVRQSFWSLTFGFTIHFIGPYALDQQVLQRFSAAKNRKHARIALLLNIPGIFIVASLCCFSGLILYANYANCDPLSNSNITNVKNPNQLIVYFVTDKMQSITGFTGLFLSSILSGSLSSVSTTLNSMAAVIWQDFLSQIYLFRVFNDKKSTICLKIIVIIVGVIATCFAIVISKLGGNLIQISGSLNGALGSPIIGVFLLGGLFPFSNKCGALFGIVSGLLMGMWLSYGAYIVKPIYPKLSVNADCYNNVTNHQFVNSTISSYTISQTPRLEKEAINLNGFNRFYSLAFSLYSMTGVIVTLLVGVGVSLITNRSKKKVNNTEFVEFNTLSKHSSFLRKTNVEATGINLNNKNIKI